jgi:hypothetical protein
VEKLASHLAHNQEIVWAEQTCATKMKKLNEAFELMSITDIKLYNNWYWVEASDFIEKLFKLNNGNPVPNYLAAEFLKLDSSKLTLDPDGVHYIRLAGSARKPLKKMIFGFKDKETAKKVCSAVANYEDFKLNVNKLFETDNEIDVACQIIRQIFEFHDEWKCNELLPEWYKQLKDSVLKVRNYLAHKGISKNDKRILTGVLARANVCLSEMTKLTVQQFHVK